MDSWWPTLVIVVLAFGVNVLYGIYKRLGHTNALLEDLHEYLGLSARVDDDE